MPTRGGHFAADARINGRTIRVLVDTGATHITVPASVARGRAVNALRR